MIDIKKLSGVMNLDDREADILQHQHLHALNGRFYGGSNGMTFENVKGNDQIGFTLPDGNNEMIGGLFDQVHQRLIWFNFNDNRRHGIYMYALESGTITPLLRCFIDSQTDILNFELDYPVSNPLILYTTELDGDILTWTIRNQRPKKLNLKQAIEGLYGANWLVEYLDVASEPPVIPIICAYEDDPASTVNNLRKKLFKFKYRYWYRDNEKSTWSTISEIPVPFKYTDPQVDTDPTKNCRIGCVIQTGDLSVVKIEIAGAESLGNVFSNYFSVAILDKTLLSIPNNDTYLWRFYNSEAYDFIDLNESLLGFSYVPDTANDQALINGNVLAYGGITEGKDPVVPICTLDVGFQNPLAIGTNIGFSVTQFGTNGFQSSQNIRIVYIGVTVFDDVPTVLIRVGGTTFTISYTIKPADTTLDVLTGLSLSATGQGFTQVSINDNELVISRVNQVLLNYYLFASEQKISALNVVITHATNTLLIANAAQYESLFYKGAQFYLFSSTTNQILLTVTGTSTASTFLFVNVVTTLADELMPSTDLYFIDPLNNSIPVYNTSSKYDFGLVYFDKKGKTNGITTSIDFNGTTSYFGINAMGSILIFTVPFFTFRIGHRPPIWAYTYQLVRSANLTKESFLYWVTDRTYKDDKFAYISVESINAYKKINKNSVISYQFLPGDRIKFYILYSAASVPIVTYQNQHDYEIIEEIINPDINGSNHTGQFLKIVLPDVDADFNFGSGITLDYFFYYIELYTPAKSASEGLEVYYEFGEEYGIGNAGTTLAFHQGSVQNQTSNLITPALIGTNKGDDWYRPRIIPIGNTLLYDLQPINYGVQGGSGGAGAVIPVILRQHLTIQAYSTNEYTVAQDVTETLFVPISYNQANWTISTNANPYTFKVIGALNLTLLQTNTGHNVWVEIYVVAANSTYTTVLLDTISNPNPGDNLIFNFNSDVTIPANSRIYFSIRSEGNNFPFVFNVINGYVSYTEPQKDFEVGVIDQNFSDFFQSKVNSNGRPDTIHPDEKTNFFGTSIRYGGQYQQNTNINQINVFYPNDFVEAYRSWGDIQRMVVWGTQLRVFQERRVGYFGIYAKYIQTSDSDTQITTTNEILTKTNIQYLQGEFGLGKQYTSVVISKNDIYFVDPVRGYQIRWAADGLTAISEIYKGQFYIRNLLIPYNGTITRPNGGSSKILGVYDTFLEEYVTILQGGETIKSATVTPYTFSFNEMRNGYSSFFSYHPEWAICAEDIIYTWLQGKLYVHNSDTYCKFYGIQYDCSITVVCNLNLIEKKTWESITELSSAIWACSEIYGNVMSYGTTRQQTMLGEYDFANLENNFHAAILRDQNSIGGILNGETMKGNYLVVKLIKQNASDLIYLTEVSIKWIDSPLTNK